MQFSIYSELQTWPGKTQQQVYAEALEQVRQCRPARLFDLLDHRALFLSEIRRLAESVRVLRQGLGAYAQHQIPHAAARAALSQPGGARLADRAVRHAGRRPLRVRPRAADTPGYRSRAACRSRNRASATRRRWRSSSRARSTSASRRRQVLQDQGLRTSCRGRRRAGNSASSSAAPATRPTNSPASAAMRWWCRRCCPTRRCARSSTSIARPAPSTATSPTSSGFTPAISTSTATPPSARPRR